MGISTQYFTAASTLANFNIYKSLCAVSQKFYNANKIDYSNAVSFA